jgi:hypothetical protein
MVIGFVGGRSAGAVYKAALEVEPEPVGTMVPRLELPPVIPFTSHVMPALVGTPKDAVKICASPRETLAAEGRREPAALQVIVMLALPELELSASLAAVTVTVAGEGGIAGAV